MTDDDIRRYAGIPDLTDTELDRIKAAICHSTIPEAVAVIADSIVADTRSN